VHVFDARRHARGGAAPPPAAAAPALRLQGHAAQGFGLAWSPLRAGHLLSGSNDARVCLWDVGAAAAAAAGTSLQPLSTFLGHEGAVGDVAWHASEAATFASVGDDGTLRLWDARLTGAAACTSSTHAHAGEAFCLALHPTQPHLLATGGADGAVALFDARRPGERLHTLEDTEAPSGDVLSLAWAPRHASVLASASGRRVALWDLGRIGAEQRDEEEEGPPELLCAHGGHALGKVSDVAWSPHDAWTLASVAEDRQLQLWAPSEDIYNDDDGVAGAGA
jgi:histone-binding protein RBBP4